jgi:glyoxylase-like metal-dependent hydrolase (beta-lactamase superfamily II)
MTVPLEDSYADIVRKAQRGLRLPGGPLPALESDIRQLAATLSLRPDALLASGRRSWHPLPTPAIEGLQCFLSPYKGMTVNSYLVTDPATGESAAFDTGMDASAMLATGISIRQVFLTHTHRDHIGGLAKLLEKTGATAFVSERETLANATPFADGAEFQIGKLRVETRRTDGHALGGTTFFVTGLEKPLAFTGDALFAGSMGGAPQRTWPQALAGLRTQILTLPSDTILCPGHGPHTTVAEEKIHNPFA